MGNLMPTLDQTLFALTLVASLGCGLIAGVFYAFSTFIMKALDHLPSEAGISAMQEINITVLTPWFLGVFLGTGVLCLGLGAHALLHWTDPASQLRFVGSVTYVIGSILVTITCNVPRNERLATMTPDQSESTGYWADYLSTWTKWNHVRTAASLASAALFAIALR
jgi:uncharacterized membrane protein